jgi:hypothetical protein
VVTERTNFLALLSIELKKLNPLKKGNNDGK